MSGEPGSSPPESTSPLIAFARGVAAGADLGPLPLMDDPQPPHERFHAHVLLLDHETRLVHCKKCGMELTPFEALVYLAKDWTIYRSNLDALRGHLDELVKRKCKLQAEVSKLKSERRRLDESIAGKRVKLAKKDVER